MAEDLPAGQILNQIIERLDLLDRVLAMNTARLHDIEKHLGIAPGPQRLAELLAAEHEGNISPAGGQPQLPSGQIRPPAAPVKTQDLNSSDLPQRNPINKPSGQTWPQAQLPEDTWLRPDKEEARVSHSWMNEASTPHSGTPPSSAAHTSNVDAHSSRVADTPFTLHVPVEAPAPERGPLRAEQVPEQKRRDLESMIGGSWFNWIGIIAVTLGMGFFLKLAFDKQWIGPAGRVTIAALVGITLLYLGERLRRRGMKSYAYILSGGGILVLYLSVFASYNLYHLIGQPVAFVLMTAVTTTAVLLSVRLNALPVALLGLVGGFLTPVLLSTGVDNEVGLFTYIALLDAGVLAVAYFKRWRSLDFASFVGTVAMTLGWAVTFFAPGKLWTTLFFLSVFFVLYALLPIFHNVLRDLTTRWFDVALALANAAFYFGLSYLMLSEVGFDHATPATQALLVCVFFTGLFYTTWRWSPDDLLLRYSYVGAAATFLTVAVAIQLELHWVTMAWAVEALMLTWVGLRSGERAARHAGFAIFCAALSHWFIWDMLVINYSLDPSFMPLLNRRALSCAVLVAAIAGASRLYRSAKWEGQVDQDERSTVLTFFALTGNGIALALLSLDLNDYFSAGASQRGPASHAAIENAKQFSITVLWTIYATTILAVGLRRRSKLLRWGGLSLLLVAIGKVLVFDSAFYAASWHLPLFNHTFMAYTLLVAALSFSAWLYGRARDVDESKQLMVPTLIGSANVLALTALSLEVIGYYNRSLASLANEQSGVEVVRQLWEAEISTIGLVWTIYALYAFMVGAGLRNRAWRFGGLLLIIITTPILFASLTYYDASWHVFVFNRTMGLFAVFVAALWLIVRTYARSSEAFEEESVVRHVAIVAANVLTLIALSTQAVGYYDAKIADELSHVAVLNPDATTSMRNLDLAKQLSLSVVWGIYASGLLVVGRMRDLRLLRVMALALLSVTTLKVFIWDLSSLDRAYRIVSFIMLGAILLVVSYFYQRRQEPVEET